MVDAFNIFKNAGIGDEEYYGIVEKNLPPLPDNSSLLKMSGSEINTLRKKYHGYPEEQSMLSPIQHRKMNENIIAEGGVLKSIVTVPAMLAGTAIYADLKDRGLLPSDVDTGKKYATEAVQGLAGIWDGVQSFISDNSTEIKRVVAPEVQKTNDIRSQVEQIMGKLITTESGGEHTTDEGTLTASNKGALGITQVLPSTAKNPGYGIKPLQNDSKEEYIRFGKDYLAKMIAVFDDTEQGIAAYNAGPGVVHRAISKASRTGKDWKEHLPKETQAYIKKIGYTESSPSSGSHKPNVTDVMGFRG